MIGTATIANFPLMHVDYCAVPVGFLNLQIGDQVRVQYNNEVAIYTVRFFSPNQKVKLNATKRLRVKPTDEENYGLEATFQGPIVVNSKFTEQEAKKQGDFIERVVDSPSSRVICIAPHGGNIDLISDVQAERVAKELNCALWLCKGYREGGGAFARWHVTSNDISRNSFPGLKALSQDRTYECCLSFHGMNTGGILIGGLAPMEWKLRLQELICEHIDNKDDIGLEPVQVRIATWQDCCNGLSKRNLCNWLTTNCSGGIQLEQDRHAREKYSREVANAVIQFAKSLF